MENGSRKRSHGVRRLFSSENHESSSSVRTVVECFDFKTGKAWHKDGVEGNTVASPSIAGGLVIVGSSKPEQLRQFVVETKV